MPGLARSMLEDCRLAMILVLSRTVWKLPSEIRSSVSENVSAARSRIPDADFATESAVMIQQNILQYAAQSILSEKPGGADCLGAPAAAAVLSSSFSSGSPGVPGLYFC